MFKKNKFIISIFSLTLFFFSFLSCKPAFAEDTTQSTGLHITTELFHENEKIDHYFHWELRDSFKDTYTDIPGILTFRGNNFRTAPSYGFIEGTPTSIEIMKRFRTSSLTWGGGAGWTGQPLIVQWPKETLDIMNVYDKFKNTEDFTEAICVSLDGHIYFFDLYTGEQSRDSITIKNPIKGTPSIDPRGYPLLYVGQGIRETDKMGYRIFSLIDGSMLHFVNGYDKLSPRHWAAFDSSALIDRENDALVLCGENGLFYYIKLNTNFDPSKPSISINPETYKLRYKGPSVTHQGIESSPATFKNLVYFSDNSGTIHCFNLITMSPVWTSSNLDDTDATITIDLENNSPYLYTGNEVDHQGTSGNVYLRKYNGITGCIDKEFIVPAYSVLGKRPVNGGVLGTSIVGKNNIDNLVIFQVARYKSMNAGLLIALNKKTFEEAWRIESPHYAWSSPVDIYTKNGDGYIINCDSIGTMTLINGGDGSEISSINLNGNIESSPAIFNNHIVVPSRNGSIYFLKIK